MVAILLLLVSNPSMTIAWYGHLRFMPEARFPLATLVVNERPKPHHALASVLVAVAAVLAVRK